MGQFKASDNNPITDTKKTKNFNPDAVITLQPPVFLDERNEKGESFNVWYMRMNAEIYKKYGVSMIAPLGGRSKDNLDKMELKSMYSKNMEASEVYKQIKDHLFGTKEENKKTNSFYIT